MTPCGVSFNKKNESQKKVNIKTGLLNGDKGKFLGYLRSSDLLLQDHPEYGPLVKRMRSAYFGPNGEIAFKYKLKNMFNETLTKNVDPKKVRDYLQNKDVALNSEEQTAAKKWREGFDYMQIFLKSKGIAKIEGKPIENYFSGMPDYRKRDSFHNLVSDVIRKSLGKDLSNPDSFKERLSKNITVDTRKPSKYKQFPRVPFSNSTLGDKTIELNPIYAIDKLIDGTARIGYRQPVLKSFYRKLNKLPKDFNHGIAQGMVNDYAGIDTSSTTSKFIKNLDRTLGSMITKSYLAFSPKLQLLHMARMVYSVAPESGNINAVKGLTAFLQDTAKGESFKDIKNLGLIEEKPWKMKTVNERLDTIGNFFDIGNKVAKAIALKSFEAKYGKNSTKAINETIKAEGMVTPTSHSPFLKEVPKFIIQFKNYIQKYGENIAQAHVDLAVKKNPESAAKLLRYYASAAFLYELQKHTNISLLHLGGVNNLIGSASMTSVARIQRNIQQGMKEDKNGHTGYSKALLEIVRDMTIGGHTIIGLDNEGNPELKLPSIFEKESK
jgi:hypothetical protein